MEKTKYINLVISGLSHYIENYDEFCEQLPIGSRVVFIHEPNNRFTPGVAFQARIDRKLVGRASKNDNFKLLPLRDKQGCVYGRVVAAKHKAIYAEVEVPEGICIPLTLEEALGTPDMCDSVLKNLDLVLPENEIQQMMQLDDLLLTPTDDPHLPAMLGEWLILAKRSLSSETMQGCRLLAERFGELAKDIQQWINDLGLTEEEYPAQAWLAQLDDARLVMENENCREEWCQLFWGSKEASPNKEQLLQTRTQIEGWLLQLPNGLWRLYHDDFRRFARQVMYASFPRVLLYRIISHILALEMVDEMLEALAPKYHATDMSSWKIAQIDPESIFRTTDCEMLNQLQQRLFTVLPRIKQRADHAFIYLALVQMKAIYDDHTFTRLFSTLALWGLVNPADVACIADSTKKRIAEYEKLKRDNSLPSRKKLDNWQSKVSEIVSKMS